MTARMRLVRSTGFQPVRFRWSRPDDARTPRSVAEDTANLREAVEPFHARADAAEIPPPTHVEVVVTTCEANVG